MTTDTPSAEALAELIRRCLQYDPDTGEVRWLVSAGPVKAGTVARSAGDGGYLRVTLAKRNFSLHRIAWFMSFGKWPAGFIDHIDGDRTNNRLANLRDVGFSVNAQNRRRAAMTSSTGVLGIFPAKKGYRAAIELNGKKYYLGSFKTPEEAGAAYLEAKRRLHVGCTI